MTTASNSRSGITRALLVDDHGVVREGYRRLLENTADIRIIEEADCGEAALDHLHKGQFDVVVLDLNMPGIGGMETLRRMRAKWPEMPILVFSMHTSRTMVSRALEAGACGFLSKRSAAAEMVEAVRAVAQGQAFLSAELVTGIVKAQKGGGNEPLASLTPREFQIFRHVAEGDSAQVIAERLSISPKTVGVHQSNIMRKLELDNAVQLTRFAIRHGVIQP